jgi:hypothetical protein
MKFDGALLQYSASGFPLWQPAARWLLRVAGTPSCPAHGGRPPTPNPSCASQCKGSAPGERAAGPLRRRRRISGRASAELHMGYRFKLVPNLIPSK